MAKKNQGDVMRRQVAKVTAMNQETQARSVKAEELLMKLEDRDARRTQRSERALSRIPQNLRR